MTQPKLPVQDFIFPATLALPTRVRTPGSLPLPWPFAGGANAAALASWPRPPGAANAPLPAAAAGAPLPLQPANCGGKVGFVTVFMMAGLSAGLQFIAPSPLPSAYTKKLTRLPTPAISASTSTWLRYTLPLFMAASGWLMGASGWIHPNVPFQSSIRPVKRAGETFIRGLPGASCCPFIAAAGRARASGSLGGCWGAPRSA
mmetsp:Transcript_46916/g.132312  ORF Transcript_46916/g.132312 Transcript_46916/m.132312 type:complete len:202 (-) Transcript_46916:8-613(-)